MKKLTSFVFVSFFSAFFFMNNVSPAIAINDLETFDDITDEIIIADAEILHDLDMSETRAGFRDPTGLLYRFGVDVRTHIDGAISYARSLVLEASAGGQIQASSSAQLDTPNLPTGTIASIINNGGGVIIDDSKGKTTVLNQTPAGAIASIVMNAADNRVVTQTIDINIILKNLPNLGPNWTGLTNISTMAQGINARMMGLRR